MYFWDIVQLPKVVDVLTLAQLKCTSLDMSGSLRVTFLTLLFCPSLSSAPFTSDLSNFRVPFTDFQDIVITVTPHVPCVSSQSGSSLAPTPVFDTTSFPIYSSSEFLNVSIPSSTSTIPSSAPNTNSIPTSTVEPSHSMRTTSQHGIFKPKYPFTLFTLVSSFPVKEPSYFSESISHHVWQEAMAEEYEALVKQGTWQLVPPQSHGHIIGCQWIYKIKMHSDGSVARYKARLVTNGNKKESSMDFTETFSLVIKQPTLRVILSLAVHYHWSLR